MKHVDRQLKAADPLRLDLAALPEQAAQALVKEIVMQPTETPAPAGRRRRTRTAVIAAVAVLAIGVPGTALGVYQGIRSGLFGTGGEAVEGEEFYRTEAPEITGVMRELAAEFPLPPGADYGRLMARYPTREPMLVQRTGLGQEVSFYAACAWYRHWLAGDAAQRDRAQATMDTIASWRYWRFAGDGGQIFGRIAREARAGDDTTLKQFVTANC
jgi:hypothetical protein